MKYLIVSDIHGCLPQLEKVLTFFEKGKYDMLLILGDILNYGPRNGVPQGLNAPGIADRLNAMKDKIVAVRGNCDSEVDQMLLQFPMMADYTILVAEGIKVFLTHGHKFNKENAPQLNGDLLCYGHTHLWELTRETNCIICNTGSITFPKEGRVATFATIDEDHRIRVRNIDGECLEEMEL